jgi:hypothetical protein
LIALACLVNATARGQTDPGGEHAEPTRLTPFSAVPGPQPPAPWHFTSLPNKEPTRFEVVQQGAQRVLRVEADQSYGNLVHRVRVPLGSATTLGWRWRVDQLVEDADLRNRAGDDSAAKLCVFFDFPLDRLPLIERARLLIARTTLNSELPSEALCYVWDNKLPRGTVLVNAYTRRMRMMVLQSGLPSTGGGAWRAEHRTLLADYRRAFADEAGGIAPDVVAVAISADADNTNGHGLAFFGDVALSGPPPPPKLHGE